VAAGLAEAEEVHGERVVSGSRSGWRRGGRVCVYDDVGSLGKPFVSCRVKERGREVWYCIPWCGGLRGIPPRSARTYISLRTVIVLGDNLSLGMSLHPLCCFPLPLLLRHPFPSFISEYSSSLPNTGDPGRAERRLACAVLLLLLVLLDRPGQSIPLTIRFSRFPPVPSRVGPYLPICLSLQSASSLSSDAGTIPRFESLA
jgi:hypothetical protein